MGHYISTRRKGQTWVPDVFAGFAIFLLAFTFLMKSHINLYAGSGAPQDLQQEAEIVSEYLMSEGYPRDWNLSNAVQIGLLTDGRLDADKCGALANMTQTEYARSKNMVGTRFNYCFYFLNQSQDTVTIAGSQHFGAPSVNCSSVPNAENLVRVSRLMVHEHSVLRMVIHIWN